jgi:hypothetical protein
LLADYLRLLNEAEIPYRTGTDDASTFGAEKVQVPAAHLSKAIEILERLNPRDLLI